MCIFEQGYVKVKNVTVAKNKASISVIAIFSSSADFVDINTFVDNKGSLLAYNATVQFIDETTFHNCSSTTSNGSVQEIPFQEGGALSVYSSYVTFHGCTVFTQNSAIYGGAIFAMESSIIFMSAHQHQPSPGPTLWSQLPYTMVSNNTALRTGGGIYLYKSTMEMREGTFSIAGNRAHDRGGGIYVISSDIRLNARSNDATNLLVLADNEAHMGGGVFLEDYSKLSLISISGMSIRLSGNVADYGAAIYVNDNSSFETCFTTPSNVTPTSECFFRTPDPNRLKQEMTNTNELEIISFENNYAKYNGSNVFGGFLSRCALHTPPNSFYNALLMGITHDEQSNDGLTHLQNISNINNLESIASLPIEVCFCTNDSVNCRDRVHSVQVKKGEMFNMSIVARDQVKYPVVAKIYSQLSSRESNLIEGSMTWISDICTNISYAITSSREIENLLIFADGPCRNSEPSRLTVSVMFSPCNCPTGFEQSHSSKSCECVCDSLISAYVTDCDLTTQSFMKKKNSWISRVNRNNQSVYVVSERCPFRYCQPPGLIRLNLSDDNGADAQCTEGHRGTSCASCVTNYAVSLAHKRCLPCSDYWYLSLLVVVIGSILAGLALVISILAINFTVAVGTINGFIFYANVIDVYDSIFLPLDTSSFPVIFIEWLDLDPGIDGCFIKNIDLYGHIWTRLIFPVYIISIVVVIIEISRRSLRFSRLIGKRNPIATLATLVLLSLTNFIETAVVSLRPITLTYLTVNGTQDETVWLADGNVKYFQGKHIPLFLVAFLIVLLTIIYITLLLFWQWAVQCPNICNLKWPRKQKVNMFIATYHAPYCDRHRYWTGLLLITRVLLVLISIFTEASGSDSSVPLLSIVFILGTLFLLKMTCVRKLYKKWPVELIELILLFNLFVFTIFTWYALDNIRMRQILAYLSTVVTFLLLLCVIAYHTYVYLIKALFPNVHQKLSKKFQSNHPQTAVDNNLKLDRFHNLVGTIQLQPSVGSHQKRQSPIMPQAPPNVVTFSTVDGPGASRKKRSRKQGNNIIVKGEKYSETPYYVIANTNPASETPM